jgi:L-amino acid N-acyltransferase YncA
MNESVKIRPATEDDAETILAMIVEHAAFEGEVFSPDNKLNKLRAAIGSGKHFECLVVEIDNKVEGYCTYMTHYDSWHHYSYLFVDGLWLNSTFRGASIGTRIFEILHKRAKELGCDTIQVMTPSTNDSGIRFYKKLGATQATKAYFTLPVRSPVEAT